MVALYRNADLWRVKVDIRGHVATAARVVLLDVVLTYVTDANIQAFRELMFYGEVVLLGIGSHGGVLCGSQKDWPRTLR